MNRLTNSFFVYAAALASMLTVLIASGLAAGQEKSTSPANSAYPGDVNAANPGTVDDATLKKTARAFVKVKQIVQNEQQALDRTSDDAQKQKIAVGAESDKLEAVKAEGLQPEQYNQVIQLAEADKNVQQKFFSYVGEMDNSPGGAQ